LTSSKTDESCSRIDYEPQISNDKTEFDLYRQ